MSTSFGSSKPPQPNSARRQTDDTTAALVANPVVDLVDGSNALAAYHEFVEASVYGRSLKSARAARDFHAELIARAQFLLTFANDEIAIASIDAEMQKVTAKLTAVPHGNVGVSAFARARRLDPNGFALLDIHEPFDVAALKSAYRVAVKRYHPDIGGDTATMQHINDTYGLFFAALHEDAAAELNNSDQPRWSAPQSASELMNDAKRAIFLAAVDDLAADTALELLPTLPLAASSTLDGSLLEAILRLAQLLSAMGKADDAHAALALGEKEFARLTARGLNFAHLFARAATIVAQPKTLRLVINHQRQADNALRFGLIDRSQYDQTIKRLNHNIAEDAAQRARLGAELGALSFQHLPLDPVGPITAPAGLVPVPGYYVRLDGLEPTQLEEYKRAFFGHDTALIVKYIFVRLNALLKAVVEGYDLASAINETKLIRDAALPKSSLEYYAAELYSLFEFFEQQGAEDRRKRFAILRDLDEVGSGDEISIRVGSTEGSVRIAVPKPINLSPAYLQFVRQPLEHLRDA